jgi:2-polyprenyl-3-methyl-5-hydroxy-6-metoxy-1,4-benzoquinol methylase
LNLRTRDNAIEELLDAPVADAGLLARNLRDIRRINRFLGWTSLAVERVGQVVARQQWQQFTLLDVSTGSADIPCAIARWATQRGIAASITASDVSEQILGSARLNCAGFPNIQIEYQDGLALGYRDQAFDVVLCSLALHHFSPEEAPRLLAELARVARHAVIVSDLARSLPAFWGAWLLTHTLMPNTLTRHDAPASVRRAYTPAEVRALAAQAGLTGANVQSAFPFRQALVWERNGG